MIYTDISSSFRTRQGTEQPFDTGEQAINNSINNILSTAKGSVPGNPFFGSDLNGLLFTNINPLIINLIKKQVENVLKLWEPRITVTEVYVEDNTDYNMILIYINYKIKSDVRSDKYEYIYKAIL